MAIENYLKLIRWLILVTICSNQMYYSVRRLKLDRRYLRPSVEPLDDSIERSRFKPATTTQTRVCKGQSLSLRAKMTNDSWNEPSTTATARRRRRGESFKDLPSQREAVEAPESDSSTSSSSSSSSSSDSFSDDSDSCRDKRKMILVEKSSKIPDIERGLWRLDLVLVVWNLVLLVKYTIICSLDLNSSKESNSSGSSGSNNNNNNNDNNHSKILQDYEYLDCLLLGRLVFNGRVTNLTNQVAWFLVVYQLVWRFVMLVVRPDFKLECYEFMMYDQRELAEAEAAEAEAHELDYEQIGYCPLLPQARQMQKAEDDWKRIRRRTTTTTAAATTTTTTRGRADPIQDDDRSRPVQRSVLQYRDPFVWLSEAICPGGGRRVAIKPNRTYKSWQQMGQYILKINLIGLVLILGFTPLFLRMQVPVMLTRRGFELSYTKCVTWILRQHQQELRLQLQLPSGDTTPVPNVIANGTEYNGSQYQQQQLYSYIYPVEAGQSIGPASLVAKKLAFLPLDGFLEMNLYHSTRLLFDVIDNLFIYLGFMSSFLLNTFISLIISKDVQLYVVEIKRKLEALRSWSVDHRQSMDIFGQHQHQHQRQRHADFISHSRQSSSGGMWRTRGLITVGSSYCRLPTVRQRGQQVDYSYDHNSGEVMRLQSMLIELFRLINDYNAFATFFTIYIILHWLTFSAFISGLFVTWLGLAESYRYEWWATQTTIIGYNIVNMGSYATVRTHTRDLYRQLTSHIAHETRLREEGAGLFYRASNDSKVQYNNYSLNHNHNHNQGHNSGCKERKSSMSIKWRWASILGYYSSGRKSHCFTAFRSTEISWFLVLRVVAWMFSAIFVILGTIEARNKASGARAGSVM